MIVDFFSICSTKSDSEIIEKLRKLPKCNLAMCRQATDTDSDTADVVEDDRQIVEQNFDSMDIDEEVERSSSHNSKSNVVVDEDGWCTIVSRKKK